MIFKIDIYKNQDSRITKVESTQGSAKDLQEATQFLNDKGFKILDPPVLGIEYYHSEEDIGAIISELKEEKFDSIKNMDFKSVRHISKKR